MALPANIRISHIGLPGTNTLITTKIVNKGRKDFYNIGPCSFPRLKPIRRRRTDSRQIRRVRRLRKRCKEKPEVLHTSRFRRPGMANVLEKTFEVSSI
jgi:hypothetical protein